MASKVKRSFGLSAEDVQELTGEYAKTKRFPNPYRAGAYGFTIDALVKLGVNKPHSLAKVHAAFKRAAGAEWYGEWVGTKKRNKETGLDADGRFLQNIRVLQRTADYALKLLQVGRDVLKSKGAVIDLTRDSKGGLLVALNLDSDTPTKPQRITVLTPTGSSKAMASKGAKPSQTKAQKPKAKAKCKTAKKSKAA